ncbi:DUF2971 domain-containing protein [Comamonas jiangduensis]|uniref:DUF2971 domain-containing protein n=1 Tax=Comamonas jiangduensis TaxID=1194168 RepID=A0ABV4IAK6_9BURK
MNLEEYKNEIGNILETMALNGGNEEVLSKISQSKGSIEDYYAAHYTRAHTPRKMLKSSNDNMMLQFDGDYMNDPEEGRYLVDVMISAAENCTHQHKSKFIEKLTALRNSNLLYSAYKQATFLSCWTIIKVKKGSEEEADSLNHWRFYGDDGKGACIMVPLSNLLSIFNKSLYKVSYGIESRGGGEKSNDRAVKKLENAFQLRLNNLRKSLPNAIIDFSEVIKETHPLLFLFKSSDYSAEEEVRSIVHKADYSSKSDVLFMGNEENPDVPKKAYIKGNPGLICNNSIIFFGPKADEKFAIETMGLACELGIDLKVFISNKPYR